MSYCEYAKDLDAEKLRQKLGVKIPAEVSEAMVWYEIGLSAPMLKALLDLLDDQMQEYVDADMTDSDTFWSLDYIQSQALYADAVVAYSKPDNEDELVLQRYENPEVSGSPWLFEYGQTGEA
jgi:hypothetical protein